MCPIMFNNTSHLFDEIASNNKDIQKDKGNIVFIIEERDEPRIKITIYQLHYLYVYGKEQPL